MEGHAMYIGEMYVVWTSSDERSERLLRWRDVCPLCLDTVEGIIYGKPLDAPPDVNEDEWLLAQAELDDRVVVDGQVIPVIGTFSPSPAESRYLAATYRSRIGSEQDLIDLACQPRRRTIQGTVSTAQRRENISITVLPDKSTVEIATHLAALCILRARAGVSTLSREIDELENALSKVMRANNLLSQEE